MERGQRWEGRAGVRTGFKTGCCVSSGQTKSCEGLDTAIYYNADVSADVWKENKPSLFTLNKLRKPKPDL